LRLSPAETFTLEDATKGVHAFVGIGEFDRPAWPTSII